MTVPAAFCRYRFTEKVALRSTCEVNRTVVTGGVAPAQVITTAVAGALLGLAEGDADAELPLPPLWLFFLLLELEQPPPLLLLLLLLPLLPLLLLPPCEENPVSANTTVTSTAVNLMRRPATMADPSPGQRRVTLSVPLRHGAGAGTAGPVRPAGMRGPGAGRSVGGETPTSEGRA